jgi:chromosome segregation ATPase
LERLAELSSASQLRTSNRKPKTQELLMSKTSMPKKSAELSAQLAQERATQTNANAEHAQLVAQSTSVVCEGVEALHRHRLLIQDAADRFEVARARAEKLNGQLAEAQEREAAADRRARYDTYVKGLKARREKYRRDLNSVYQQLFDALTAGKAEQDEIDAINMDLPPGAPSIEHFEAEMRHTPAVPERQEIVEVQRAVNDGRDSPWRVGALPPMETVKETRVVHGTRARRPAPLWEVVELPSLDRSVEMLRVAGTWRPPGSVISG